MANIFASGEELLNKKDFDDKVNINQPMFKRIDNANTWSDILSDPKSANTLMSIRDNTNGGLPSTDGNVIGGNGAAIAFGGDDTHAIISVSWFEPVIRVAAGAGDNIKWYEDLAFKSDIAELKQEIADLKKQIGGVLSSALSHIRQSLRYVAFKEMEVA